MCTRKSILLAGLILLLPAPGLAGEIEGVRFAEQREIADTPLRLQGLGLLRYRVVFKGYVAAFYLGEGVEPTAALGDVPRRLEIEYFWSIPADAFAEATVEGVKRNVDAATYERLADRIEQMNGLYQGVEPGDRYAITYVPGVGTQLALNGEVRGSIEGADFASALFSIWLGDRPLDGSLKRKLLGAL